MNEQAMNEELTKSLVALIDETLEEIEELKKSSKFAASEVKIEGPGEGIDGKPVNGSLEAKKAEDKKDDEDEDKKKKDDEDAEKKKKEMEKGVNEEKDVKKAEDKKDDEDAEKKKKEMEKGVNEEKDVKKSDEPKMEELMKSYMDSRINPLETKLTELMGMVSKIAEMPVDRKGVPAGVQPLKKSEDSARSTLSKSEIANKLLELKKSGEKVDSLDLVKVETGSMADAAIVANKYNIK